MSSLRRFMMHQPVVNILTRRHGVFPSRYNQLLSPSSSPSHDPVVQRVFIRALHVFSPAIYTKDHYKDIHSGSYYNVTGEIKDVPLQRLRNGYRPAFQNSRSVLRSPWCSTMQVSGFSPTTKHTPPIPDDSNSAAGQGGSCGNDSGTNAIGDGDNVSFAETKKLMRLVNVESLKMKLGMDDKEVIGYSELLEACESGGVAKSKNDAIAFAQVLDEAGVILLFRDKVYLHPDKVVDLVRRAIPLALTPEDDPRRGELKRLQDEKEEIDVLAHKQVRRILWAGLGASVLQVGLFFRLTFWEFSWDVMEPIAFFTTATGIVVGYAYFLFTSRDPSYQDLMKRLFLSRQRKLFKRQKFDVDRLLELQRKCQSPLDVSRAMKNKVKLDLEPDTLHAH